MLFLFLTFAAVVAAVNLTRLNIDTELISPVIHGGINLGERPVKTIDPNLFEGIDLKGIDLSKIHTQPNLLLKDRPLKTVKLNDPLFGNRPVSYYATSNNLAIIDGDVTYGPVSSLFAHSSSAKAKTKRAFSGKPVWPNAEVKYRYNSATTASAIQHLVDDAINVWRTAAPWLRFTRLPDSPTTSNGILTITSNNCDGCHASLGYSPNSPSYMNLGMDASCGDSCGAPVALHEFGHVLGLYHEHQRPDRGEHVDYHCENLAPLCRNGKFMKQNTNCCNNAEPECCQNAGNFNYIADTSLDWSGPYDLNSVMHYPAGLFALAGKNTLTSSNPSAPVPVSNPSSVTAGDLERICRRHPLECKPICRDIQCPPPCDIVRPCPNSKSCRPPTRWVDEWTPPDCCPTSGHENTECKAWKNKCKAHGCPSGPN